MGDLVWFITGGTSGIGAATARRAAAAGDRAFVTGRNRERLDALLAEADRGAFDGMLADVSDWEETERAVETALARFGRLDVVFANAGVGVDGDFATGDPDQWRELILTNVLGVALTVKATLPALVETRGRLVLTGSVVGRHLLPGNLYSATKAAVHAIGESLRQQLADAGVAVTVLEPGIVDTPWYGQPLPLPMLAAEEVADAVVWAAHRPPEVHIGTLAIRPAGQRR